MQTAMAILLCMAAVLCVTRLQTGHAPREDARAASRMLYSPGEVLYDGDRVLGGGTIDSVKYTFAKSGACQNPPSSLSGMSDSYFDLPSRIEDAFAEIDSDIVMDLLNTDEDYAALSDRMDKLKTQYPVIDKVNEDSGEIRMTAEEHRAYVDYLNLARQMEDMERQHIYFRGHTDAVAYLKKIKAI